MAERLESVDQNRVERLRTFVILTIHGLQKLHFTNDGVGGHHTSIINKILFFTNLIQYQVWCPQRSHHGCYSFLVELLWSIIHFGKIVNACKTIVPVQMTPFRSHITELHTVSLAGVGNSGRQGFK